MTTIPQGFILMVILIIIFILISIQFTLNLILKELRAIRARINDQRTGETHKRTMDDF